MKLEGELTAALIDGYERAGKELGYWAHRYVQALRRNGGLVTAKRMLEPRTSEQRKGLDTLLDAARPDLTLESIISQQQFRSLFTSSELRIAADRLGNFEKTIELIRSTRERLYPDEIEPGQKCVEGARKIVRVNAYERNAKARKACIKQYGVACDVCGIDFEAAYGVIGKGFIHVHHLDPIALSDGEYEIDPIKDLRPVCPNCHAMLHRGEKLLRIAELKAMLSKNRGAGE